MNQDLIHKMLRYLTQGAVIYLLFKYVPNTPMKDTDILIMTAIILLIYIIVENSYQMYFGKPQQVQSCGCDAKEGFTSTTDSSGNSDNISIGSSAVSQNSDMSSQLQKQDAQIKELQTYIQTLKDMNNIASQSQLSFQQGQQQMQQAQALLFGQSTQNDIAQANKVASTVAPETRQAPQVTFPVSGEQSTANGYKKNADGTFTITATNPTSQTPFASNYTDYNTIPISTGPNTFEYGYSFLPPSNWYPTPIVPPVCVNTGPTCPVCPIYTEGTNMDLKEWKSSLSVMPTEQINLKIN